MHTKDSPAAALWNPTAIALWSVPFSPLFGAWLHMHNWTALGDARQADVARRWFNALLILMVFNVLVEAIGERVNSSAGMASWISLAAFVAWYALAARPHAKAVRERAGSAYQRRKWDAALLMGVLAGLAFYGYARLASALFSWLT